MSSKATEKIEDGFASFYNDELLSDVKIHFGTEVFHGHKVILCRKSQFFKKALTGSLQEAQTGIVKLNKDDNPKHIKAMLRHIYDLKVYDDMEALASQASLFLIGDYYDVPSLRKGIIEHLEGTTLHEYAVATNANTMASDPDFATCLQIAFSEPAADRSLQKLLVATCISIMPQLVENIVFMDKLAGIPELAMKLFKHVYQAKGKKSESQGERIWECTRCGVEGRRILSTSRSCPICRNRSCVPAGKFINKT